MNFLFVATILLSTNTSWFLIIFHSILFLVYECIAQISLKILIRLHFKLSFGLQIMFPLGLVFQATGISQMSGGPPHSRGWGGWGRLWKPGKPAGRKASLHLGGWEAHVTLWDPYLLGAEALLEDLTSP